MQHKLKSLFGTKEFYKRVLLIALPVMLQQGITSFVSLLDNIMVGNYDDLAMTGVGVTNQIYFVLQIVIIGGLAASGIFLAQYFGAKNDEGMRNCFRFKIQYGLIVLVISTILLTTQYEFFIDCFLTNPATEEEKIIIFSYAKDYLFYMLAGIIPFIITQIYASSLREIGDAKLPFISGVAAVGVNFIINYLLIEGHFGCPRLGVLGAALGTISARIVECLIIVIVTHIKIKKYSFIKGVYKTIWVPIELQNRIVIKGAPLVLNEFMWSLGMTVLMILYSKRGTDVLQAMNISSTITNLFFIVFNALATAISIIVGQSLGAGKLNEAYDGAKKLLAFAVIVCFIAGIILASISYFVPMIYKDVPRNSQLLATYFMLVVALCIPIFGFNSGCFFTLRAGGVTVVTFLFDSFYVWVICIPATVLFVNFTMMNIVLLYLLVQLLDFDKSIIGFFMIKSKVWVKNLAEQQKV